MNTVLPFTTNPQRMRGCEKMKLLNPNSSSVSGPSVSLRPARAVPNGVLEGWDADAAAAMLAVPKLLHTWDVSWTDHDAYFEKNALSCNCPEEVEDMLPSKWIAYRVNSEVDDTLARVCKLCTALVDRFVSLSNGDDADNSTAKWRQRQSLFDRLSAVMELLEASVGEAIPILKLRDPNFVRECWNALEEDERQDILSSLSAIQES
jgi:hypothetical protein